MAAQQNNSIGRNSFTRDDDQVIIASRQAALEIERRGLPPRSFNMESPSLGRGGRYVEAMD